MIVGFVLKSDEKNKIDNHIVSVDTNDPFEAMDVVYESYDKNQIVRCMAVIEGKKGKKYDIQIRK